MLERFHGVRGLVLTKGRLSEKGWEDKVNGDHAVCLGEQQVGCDQSYTCRLGEEMVKGWFSVR